MFNDIYTKMFPSLFNTIDSMNENLEDLMEWIQQI